MTLYSSGQKPLSNEVMRYDIEDFEAKKRNLQLELCLELNGKVKQIS